MSYIVSEKDAGRIRLLETDPVQSVLQNVAIILSTRRGSCPMYREFGLPMKFLDKPGTPGMKIIMFAEIDQALKQFEPRASLSRVLPVEDQDFPGRIILTVEVDVSGED